jgi:peptide deformylase
MQILQYPNDHLRIQTKSVEKVTSELVETAKEMYKVMREANGLGLAATQVGLDISLLVIEDAGHMCALFNPKILKQSKEQEYDMEGCLSFIGQYLCIKRPLEVTVKFRDINNKMQHRIFIGLQARAILHEYEHLRGILFIDKPQKEQND